MPGYSTHHFLQRRRLPLLGLLGALSLLVGCAATDQHKHDLQAQQANAMNTDAGQCRIWLAGPASPVQPHPAWSAGMRTGAVSKTADCRQLMAEMPHGGVLIGP